MSGLQRIEARDHAAEAADVHRLTRRLFTELGICTGSVSIDRLDVEEAIQRAVSFGRQLATAELAGERMCRVCGCTEFNACEGGCAWAGQEALCTTCADPQIEF